MNLPRLKCRADNHHAVKAFVSPAATITDYAAIVVLCERDIIGRQDELQLIECLPWRAGLLLDSI